MRTFSQSGLTRDRSLQLASPLLHELKEDFSDIWWQRYRDLVGKRQAETLTPEEHRELTALTDTLEEVSVWRARALGKVANLLEMRVEQLVDLAGVQPRPVG